MQGCWHFPAGADDQWLCVDVSKGLDAKLDTLPVSRQKRPSAVRNTSSSSSEGGGKGDGKDRGSLTAGTGNGLSLSDEKGEESPTMEKVAATDENFKTVSWFNAVSVRMIFRFFVKPSINWTIFLTECVLNPKSQMTFCDDFFLVISVQFATDYCFFVVLASLLHVCRNWFLFGKYNTVAFFFRKCSTVHRGGPANFPTDPFGVDPCLSLSLLVVVT